MGIKIILVPVCNVFVLAAILCHGQNWHADVRYVVPNITSIKELSDATRIPVMVLLTAPLYGVHILGGAILQIPSKIGLSTPS